jgi:hypothetical protein
MTDVPSVVDYGNVMTVYVDGLGRIEEYGPCSYRPSLAVKALVGKGGFQGFFGPG